MRYSATVARIHRYGPPEVLKFEKVEVGDPGPGQVVVRNIVLGLNFVDVYYRRGTFPVPSLPYILGNEAAGIVVALGDGVTEFQVGDRVAYCDDINGSYATMRLYAADRLVAIPDDITDEQACSIPAFCRRSFNSMDFLCPTETTGAATCGRALQCTA